MAAAAQQYSKTASAMSDMTKRMSESTMANEKLVRGMSDVGKAAKAANDNLASSGRSASGAGAAVDNLTKRNQLARYELINLSRQIQDVGVSLASGQNFFTVAIQQGSQIADVFQTSGVSAAGFGKQLLGMLSPMTLLVGGAAAVVGAIALMAKAWSDMAIQADNLSKRLGAPIAQLQELQGAAAIKGIDTDAFTKGMEAFGDSLSQARKGLGDLKELFRLNGQAVEQDMLPNFLKVADLVKNAKTEVDKLNVLQAAGLPRTQDWVRLMEQGGDAVRKAAQEMGNAHVSQDMVDSARKFQESWNKAWSEFKTTAMAVIGEILEALQGLIELVQPFFDILKAVMDFAGKGVQSVLGSAQTHGDEIDASFDPNAPKITVGGGMIGPPKPTVTPEDLRAMEHELSLMKQRLALLGDMATSEEKAAVFRKEAQIAQLKGVSISKKEIDARAKNIELDLEHGAKLKELKQDYSAIEQAIESFAGALIHAMLEGATATEALGKAMQSLGAQMINIGTQDFAKSISKSISDLLPQLGSMFGGMGGGLATAGIGIGISLIGKLFGGGDNKAEQQAQQKAAAEAERQRVEREKQIAEAQIRAADYSLRAALALEKSDFIKKIKEFDAESQRQFDAESKRAGDLAINELIAARAAERSKLIFESMDEAIKTLEGKDLSDVQQRLIDINEAAATLGETLLQAGHSAEVAAEAVDKKLNESLQELTDTFLTDLGAKINELKGQGFKNQASDLIKEVAQMRSDAAALGTDTAMIDEFYVLSAQEIIDQNKLTGESYQALVDELGLANAGLHEFSEAVDDVAQAVKRSMDEIISAVQTNSDALFTLQQDQTTLEGALAVFDLQARRQVEAELKAGGEALTSLLALQQQQRLNIVEDFNQKALQEEQDAAKALADAHAKQFAEELAAEIKAAEDRKRVMDEATRFVTGALQNITAWIQHFQAGAQSNLSPSARLAAAQSAFTTQKNLAIGGNRDALSGITQNAQDVIDAATAYYGSSAAGQAIIANIISQLQTLPAQVSPEKFIVDGFAASMETQTNALEDAFGDLQTAVNSGSASAIAAALENSALFQSIDTNTDNALSFTEMQNALGGTYSTGTLRSIFTELDGNGNGVLERAELINRSLGGSATVEAGASAGVRGTATNTGATASSTSAIAGSTSATAGNTGAAGTSGTIATALSLSGSVGLNVKDTKDNTDGIWNDTFDMKPDLNDVNNQTYALQNEITNAKLDSMEQNIREQNSGWGFGWPPPGSTYSTSQPGIPVHELGGWIGGKSHAMGGTVIEAEAGEFIVREPIARNNPWLSDFNATGLMPGIFAANDNGGASIVAAIRRMERSILLGIQALIQTELQAAGIISRPIEEANKLQRARRGEKKVA
jgi:hypothetical protein